jgi:hypothetical protein
VIIYAPLDVVIDDVNLVLQFSPECGAAFTLEVNSINRGKYADCEGKEEQVSHGRLTGRPGGG